MRPRRYSLSKSPSPKPLKLPLILPIYFSSSCVVALLSQRDPKWYDFSGKGYHGALSVASFEASTRFGPAVFFDGDTAIVSLAKRHNLSSISKITILSWVYPTNSGTYHTIFTKRTESTYPFHLRIGGGSGDGYLGFFWSDSSAFNSYSQDTITPPLNTWSFVGARFDYSTPDTVDYIYNGELTQVDRAVGSGTDPDNPDVPFTIGATNQNLFPFYGSIAILLMFNEILPMEEIKSIYDHG